MPAMTRDGWRNREGCTGDAAPGYAFKLPLVRHIHVSAFAIDLTIPLCRRRDGYDAGTDGRTPVGGRHQRLVREQ